MLNDDLGMIKLVLEIDGAERVLAHQIFHVKNAATGERRSSEKLAPIIAAAFQKVIGDARENVTLYGMQGIVDSARAKGEAERKLAKKRKDQ